MKQLASLIESRNIANTPIKPMPKSVPATQLPDLKKIPFTNLCVSVYELPVKSDAAVDALKIFHNHRGRYRLESVNGSCRYTVCVVFFK
ncbi:hypothetical protein HanPI659440_Chr14g0567551 [Helianthus annuus]|nr:hypothetical protein HanPI659440_Chr14g0567551 [Helianthus annuus]